MKKILFATTALIATASVAAADVRISGYGRFGLDYNENNDRVGGVATGALNGRSETNITSRLRLQFDMSTETDSGVSFGARFRAQAESRDNAPGTTMFAPTSTGTTTKGAFFNGARFFASYEGFTLQVGNIIGAIENTPGMYLETRTAGIGIDGAGFESLVSIVNGEGFNFDSYSSTGAGANGVEVLYSANGFTGHISYSADNGPAQISGLISEQDTRVAAMAAYTFGDWTAALAIQSSDRRFEDKTMLTVSGDIGQFGVRFAYADNDGLGKYGLYGNMDVGAAGNVVAYVTSEDAVDAADVLAGRANNVDGVAGSNDREGTGFGIHYSYDLGGGVSFETGYRRASNDNDTFQAGVYFSF